MLIQAPKSVLFRHISRFDDVFQLIDTPEMTPIKIMERDNMFLSSYCAVMNHERSQYIHVRPSRSVVDYLQRWIAAIPNDVIHFGLTKQPNVVGEWLVTVEYNQIYGSRYLAVLDGRSLPKIIERG